MTLSCTRFIAGLDAVCMTASSANSGPCRNLTAFQQCKDIMLRTWRAFFLLIALSATAASAADVTYPPASRIGIVPPPGMQLSTRFWGFEDHAKGAVIVLTGLPARAFAEFEQTDS